MFIKHFFTTKDKHIIVYLKIDNCIFVLNGKDTQWYLNEKHIQECIDFGIKPDNNIEKKEVI